MIQHKSVDHIPKVCEHSTLLTNHWLVFRQIHNLGAVGDKDKLIDFEINGQRSKVKVTTRSNTVKITRSKTHLSGGSIYTHRPTVCRPRTSSWRRNKDQFE